MFDELKQQLWLVVEKHPLTTFSVECHAYEVETIISVQTNHVVAFLEHGGLEDLQGGCYVYFEGWHQAYLFDLLELFNLYPFESIFGKLCAQVAVRVFLWVKRVVHRVKNEG